MTIKPLFLFGLTLLIGSCRTQKDLQIEYIFSQERSDTVRIDNKVINAEESCWFVNNYIDNPQSDAIIDSFAFKNLKDKHLKRDIYGMLFYAWPEGIENKDPETNRKEIGNQLTETGLIYSYYWEKGKFLGKEKHYVPNQEMFKIERIKSDSLN